jgi:hypothetical protein
VIFSYVYTMHFDHNNPSRFFLPSFNNFNRFDYSVFIHSYNILQSSSRASKILSFHPLTSIPIPNSHPFVFMTLFFFWSRLTSRPSIPNQIVCSMIATVLTLELHFGSLFFFSSFQFLNFITFIVCLLSFYYMYIAYNLL